ncbi:hypothetical protein [Sulfurimonas sp.]|uniref:hypothetical protein n=1 Tax=Sulfurimonas sp. TaxID=2022749 RepID=UPI0019E997A9|nr:hypothetical protein [Sulfurimonas sp.]MBE0515253.1 hypothetical protein [Sulfurimonas sp.]
MKFILYILIFILFIPKINLIDIHASSGLRIDDLFLLIILVLILTTIFLNRNYLNFVFKFKPYFIVLFIMLLSLYSMLLNEQLTFTNFLYSVRILEYSIFIILGYYLFKYRFNLTQIFIVYCCVSVFIIFLQYFGIIGGFELGRYTAYTSSRPIGLTAGPWEVSLLLVFGLVLLQHFNRKKIYIVIGTLFFIIAIALTGSRVGLLSALVVLMLIHKAKFLIYGSFLIPVLIAVLILLPNISVIERSANLFNTGNLQMVSTIYENIDLNNKFSEQYANVDMASELHDVSWLIRTNKWMYIIKNNTSSIQTIMFGFSPGYYGSAVDGSYLRIFGELGIVGLFLYTILFMHMMINNTMKLILVAIFVNMIFIDVIYAYKIMSVLFLLYGYYMAERLLKGKEKYASNINDNSNL